MADSRVTKTFKARITGTERTEMVQIFDDAAFITGKFVVKFRSLKISRPYPLVLLVNVGRRQCKALGSDSEMLHYGRTLILALKELRKKLAVQSKNTVF
jgi:hypothetical protein